MLERQRREGKKVPVRTLSEADILRRMTPQDLENAHDLISFLLSRNGASYDDVARFQIEAEEFMEPLRKQSTAIQARKEEQRLGRRRFFEEMRKWAMIAGGVAVPGYLAFSCFDNNWGQSAQNRAAEERAAQAAREREISRVLEAGNTLGVEPSIRSFSGWSIRYPRREAGVEYAPTNIVSTPLESGQVIMLPGDKLNALEDTGIFIRDHIRTTDNVPVGRLAISAKYTPSTSVYNSNSRTTDVIPERYDIGEERVLRAEPSENINTDVIVIEKPASGKTLYLSVARSRAVDGQNVTFQLRVMEQRKS